MVRKTLLLYLALATLAMTAPARGWAMFLPAAGGEPRTDSDGTRRLLESKVVEQRLIDLGLAPAEARVRVNSLPDEQLHRFAEMPGSLQAGGALVDVFIISLFVTVLAVGILELSGHTFVVK